MRYLIYTITGLMALISCSDEEVRPTVDKLILLSGENPEGKQWKMTSFKTISNYCTADVAKFQTTEDWDNYPEAIKDNVTRIYPNGKVEIDEGDVGYGSGSPQVYVDQQFWTMNHAQDSVAIVDYVNLPSINSTWGLQVTMDKIVLTRKELNIVYEGSSLTQIVTFYPAHR